MLSWLVPLHTHSHMHTRAHNHTRTHKHISKYTQSRIEMGGRQTMQMYLHSPEIPILEKVPKGVSSLKVIIFAWTCEGVRYPYVYLDVRTHWCTDLHGVTAVYRTLRSSSSSLSSTSVWSQFNSHNSTYFVSVAWGIKSMCLHGAIYLHPYSGHKVGHK